MLNFRTLCVSAILVSAAAAATTLALRPSLLQEPPQPTKQHKKLMESIGEWEGTLSMSMPGMEGDYPARDTITAFGPFWTQSNFFCEFPEMPMPYNGTGVVGFDPIENEYVGTWIHNTDPAIAVMRGTINDAGDLEMHWEAPMYGSDEMVPNRSVTKQTKDTYEAKFYMGEGEAEMNHMTITMKRKK